MRKKDDRQFIELTLVAVDDLGDCWELELEEKSYFCVPKKKGIVPRPGQCVRLYCEGLCHSIRGIDIDGKCVFYMSKEATSEKHKKWCKKIDSEYKRSFKKAKASLDARFDKLPTVFQQRMKKLRDRDPEFRWRYESYEIFVYEEAILIAETLKSPQVIEECQISGFKGIWTKIPKLSEGHSPNTLACACSLAKLYLENPEAVAGK